MARPLLPAWCLALLLACTGGEPRPPDDLAAAPTPPPPAAAPATDVPLATDVVLLAAARPKVGVGDDLALELHVRNDTDAAITVVRPVYGSWEHARQPDYRLEWSDEHGRSVLDPLGFAPGLDCGVLDPILPDDRILVAPAGEQRLGASAVARPQHRVLPSARPGRYDLRVRYVGLDIPDATPLHLLSDPIAVEIQGGDPTAWACRAAQISAAADHEAIDVAPARLLPADDGHWLLYSRHIHTVRAGKTTLHGDIHLRKLGPDLAPVGDPIRLHTTREPVGWVDVTHVPDGLLLAFTPGPVGGRTVQTLHVDTRTAAPKPAKPRVLQRAPGNPYVVHLARAGDRVAILHHGPGDTLAPLMLSVLDLTGAPLGKPARVTAMATDHALAADGDAFLATWLQRGEFDGGVVQRFDRDGRPQGDPAQFPIDPAHSLAGVRHHPGGFDIAYVDSGARGDDPGDLMGLYLRPFDPTGRALALRTPLARESRTAATFGVVAWHGAAPLAAWLDEQTLQLARPPAAARTVSASAEERLIFTALPDRLALLWEDTRDDRSPACLKLDECAAEVYGALVRPDGTLAGAPIRLTHAAAPRPLVPSSFDWQRHCK